LGREGKEDGIDLRRGEEGVLEDKGKEEKSIV
jgi:hypothetical protein